MPPTPLVIGLAGGTGSSKTTVANVILQRVGASRIAYVPHDAYYRSFADLPPAQQAAINWDHPDSLDTELMVEQVATVKPGRPIEPPAYDCPTNLRTAAQHHTYPQAI